MQNQKTADYIIANLEKFNSDADFIKARLVVSENNKFRPEQISAAKEALNMLYPVETIKTVMQKSVKRIVQMSHVIANGLVTEIDTAYAICASLAMITNDSKPLNYASVHSVHGLHVEGRDVRAISGVSKAKLNKFLGLSGAASTITTKDSYAFGKNGIFTALGICKKIDKSTIQFDLNARDNCAFLIAYSRALCSIKDSDFLSIQDKFENKKKK